MANILGIKEVTLAQISDKTHAINVVGNLAANARASVYQPAVVRVTDAADDDGSTGGVPEGMALFESKHHGQPWCNDKGHKLHKLWPLAGAAQAPINTAGGDDDDFTVIYPDFDYTTFE